MTSPRSSNWRSSSGSDPSVRRERGGERPGSARSKSVPWSTRIGCREVVRTWRQERVTEVDVSPGLLRAKVWGSRTEPYSTSLSLRTLADVEWDLVLDVVMSKAGNVAALLSGEVPQSIGSLVLPDRGDLGPACSCPDWAEPCKHAAALCYVAADLFDTDPFALLMLRGRSRDQVLTEVRARRSAHLGVPLKPTSHQPRWRRPRSARWCRVQAHAREL